MASMRTIVLDTGKEELLQPDIITYPKYFKLSDKIFNIDSSLDLTDETSFWYQQDIDIYKVIDKDTIEFTCIVEATSNTNDIGSIVLFFDDPNSENDIPFLMGVFDNVIGPGNKIIITIQFKLTNASEKIDFSFIQIDKMEEGLLSLNNLIILGNQITKNTTLLNQLYIKDVLDTPCITSETFSF